jgi:transport inhibitor response 1
MPRLNVEVIDESGPPDSRPDSCPVEKLYIYRSIAGPRLDIPGFVWTMGDDSSRKIELDVAGVEAQFRNL